MNIKIAIADDNSFLIAAVKEKLSFFEDINVKFSAMNGQELIKKIEDNHNIDIILMDIEMPTLNGIQATEIIKQKYPQIKIIMLTVFDDDENIFNAIKAGADGYLLKEVNPTAFVCSTVLTFEDSSFVVPLTESYKICGSDLFLCLNHTQSG
jgi:DNA-binding NarL/FixJ family response regulator